MYILLLQTGHAARDVPEEMPLEEGVDLVDEKKRGSTVVKAKRDAERTEHR